MSNRHIIDPSQILEDAREEQFCQLLASGSTQFAAFGSVYHSTDRANASRKAGYPRIAARVKWLRTQASQSIVEQTVSKMTDITVAAVKATVLNRQFVIEGLTRNARIAMGEELVTIRKAIKDEDGETQVVEARVTMRDAGAANRAYELLGKEVGMFEGDGAEKDGKDRTEKAPIKTTDNERAVAFLERHFAGQTPAAMLGKKFRRVVGNA